jgi:hypothetical protein
VLAWEPPGRLLLGWQLGAEWKYDPDFLTELELTFAELPFVDIVKLGYALYEAEGFPFIHPRELPEAEARLEAQSHFDEWFPSAAAFARGASYFCEIDRPKEAAFNYHQSVERFYHCALLVLALYSPLCRARHSGVYAARRTMPNRSGIMSSANALAEIGAA